MMNNNKILTVSYGTFSCTLEGFDDSFGTMKAIAEYFRDLASDDRYFGAEPPQPDADMLARIAQKEVSRRVEAREQDGKIVLSALAGASAATVTHDAAVSESPAPVETPEPKIESHETSASTDHVDDAPVILETDINVQEITEDNAVETTPLASDEITELTQTDDVIEIDAAGTAAELTAPIDVTAELDTKDDIVIADVPAKEAEVDIVEADIIPSDILDNVSALVADDASPEVSEESVQTASEESPTVETPTEETHVGDENDIVPGQPDADVEAFFAGNATQEVPEEEVEAQVAVAPTDAPAPDSIAAKLQRIRAVVAQHDSSDEDDIYSEDEHADPSDAVATDTTTSPDVAQDVAQEDLDQDDATSDVIATARADLEEALEADDAQAEVAKDDAIETQTDDVSAILSRLENEVVNVAAKDVPEDDAIDVATAEVDVPTFEEEAVDNLFDEDENADPADNTQPLVANAIAETIKEDTKEKAAGTARKLEQLDEPKQVAARRARVIKVKRADLEAAIQKGDLEEYDDTETETPVVADAPALDDLAPARKSTTTLSAEDEAELAKELADLEADIAAGAKAATQPETEQPAPSESAARALLPSIEEDNSPDMNRLLAETDQQMDEPESATRRDAFAHLRAAVAAKKADSTMDNEDASSDDAYREDLAEVVRPRRPTAAQSRTDRPADARPAPLKLVAEQRVDVDQPKPSGPVRPRRVAAITQAAPEETDGESFAEFATEMGATTLPQLLEAAAAYMSFVEGHDQFSRPQLMTKVRQAGSEEGFSREEGLRSFGQLLRAGKIEKIKGGRFTVSDDIGFRPDHRAAG
ncbi:MAG: hypothetical protein ABJL67_07310 [Sulfitobacter sp.]